jgi:predicted transcriptional regulator
LDLDDEDMNGRWENLPETTRASVLTLLARLIAKGVVSDEEGNDD